MGFVLDYCTDVTKEFIKRGFGFLLGGIGK